MSLSASITKLSHDGRGIAKIAGKTTFVRYALPSETVTIRYTQRKASFDEATVEHIQQPSEHRVVPRCPHFTLCGGCSLQHYQPNQQILAKQAILLEQLQHIHLQATFKVLPPVTGPTWQYRHKARLSVRYVEKKQKLLIGFREQSQPRFIADISRCEILHPSVGQRIESLKALINQLSIKRDIPQIEVAISREQVVLIIRHQRPFSDNDSKQLATYAQQEGLTIYCQPQGIDSIHALGDKSQSMQPLSYTLSDDKLQFSYHPTDFTQVNPEINQKMVRLAVSLLDCQASDHILDLFCGLGNFSLAIAKHCQHVTGIEGEQTMVDRATGNAALNHIHNAAFYCADLHQSPPNSSLLTGPYNKVLLDPPRSGAQAIAEYLTQHCVEKIVYVSCNPATLVRDAGILLASKRYQISQVGVIDMFPHTSHVESIVTFDKL